MKLYTKTGDDGTTGLLGGARVLKHEPRVSAYGDVDELNAVLGWVLAAGTAALDGQRLQKVQEDLFVLGAELACPVDSSAGQSMFVPLQEGAVQALEHWIDEASAAAAPLAHFILPGGAEMGARLHVARGVCRRAERSVVALAQRERVRPFVVHYLNRLGDLLFAWARMVNNREGTPEIPWRPRRP